MQETTSREKILKKIRKALVSRGDSFYLNADFETPLFPADEELPEIRFANTFTSLGGKFIFCIDQSEAKENLMELFHYNNWENVLFDEEEVFAYLEGSAIKRLNEPEENTPVIRVTMCESLVAPSGSILLSSAQTKRRAAADCDVHIVIAYTSQLTSGINDAFARIKEKYDARFPSMMTFVTGPSRTADIEQNIVVGAHGAAELYCFLIED